MFFFYGWGGGGVRGGGGGGADMKVDGDKLEVESFPVKNFHPGRVSNFEPKRPEA